MIYEGRVATVLPGMDEEFVSRVINEYFPMVEKHGGKVIGVFQTVIGNGNEFYYVLGFDDLSHRDRVFQSMRGVQDYQEVAARWTKKPSISNLYSTILKQPRIPFVRSTAGAP